MADIWVRYSNYFSGHKQGWSESLVYKANTENLTSELAFVDPISTARAALLANGYTLTDIRLAILQRADGTRPKRLVRLSEVGKPGNGATWKPAMPNLRCMLQFVTSDNLYSKKLFLGGCPAALGDDGKTPDQEVLTWKTKFNNWKSKLIFSNFGWLGSTVLQTAVINSYTLDDVSGRVTFALAAPGMTWPVGAGKRVAVRIKLPGKNPLDGNQVVVVTNATSCFTAKGIGVAPFIVGEIGTMELLGPVFHGVGTSAPGQIPSGDIFAQRIVSHKTGRPTYASRGRLGERVLW